MRALGPLVAAGLWLAATAPPVAAQVEARAAGEGSPSSTAALDVPYLPQSELLCGGAALAMVERWWGRRGVYAEDFAALVRPARGGILTTDLEAAARSRGWRVGHVDSTAASVRRSLALGVPVVALIQVGPGRYHYVVVLSWADGRVTYHDPAGAPFTTDDDDDFLTRWTGARRWALAIEPEPAASAPPADSAPAPADAAKRNSPPGGALPCPPWLDRAVDASDGGRLAQAETLLAQAARACPGEPLILRERAAVRFKQRRYEEARRLGDAYVALAPSDTLGWQLAATTRYLAGDRAAALRAWNRIGRPIVDLVRIDGFSAIRFRVLADAMAVPHGRMLTPPALALAQRRLAEIPAVALSAVDYQPVEGGVVEVRAGVLERPTLPPLWQLLAVNLVGAATKGEVGVDVASPIGAGELWSGTWRWGTERPRTAIRLDVPVSIGIPGVFEVEGAWERFRFALDPARTRIQADRRRSAAVGFGAWISSGLRPSLGARLERWEGGRAYLAATAGIDARARDDRLRFRTSIDHALALGAQRAYTRTSLTAGWASALGLAKPAWSVRLGWDHASSSTPIGVLPIAGGNLQWAIPLRAHPARDGFLLGRNAGRDLLHAGLAVDHPVLRLGPAILGAGLFADGAEIVRPLDGAVPRRWDLDLGGGLRLGLGDGRTGTLRLDLAHGVADGRWALTAGLHRDWPLFE